MTEAPTPPNGEDGLATEDPFSSEFAPAFQLVTLMRIYDVGMALLNEKNPEAAAKLHQVHESGKLLGSFPWINPDDD